MNGIKSPKAIAMVSTALFVVSLFWLMNVKRVNSSLEAGLESEKLKSEALLSEKLLLQKDIEQFRADLASLSGKNNDLDFLLQSANAKLNANESEFNRLKKQNASLSQIRKQRDELVALQRELQSKLDELQHGYAALKHENSALNASVASLQARNNYLSEELTRAMIASLDQSKVEALKGKNERLTVKAKRTKKLLATFEVPADLKNLSFRLKDTQGNVLKDDAGTIASRVISSDPAYASMDQTEPAGRLKKIEMVYLPKEKLKPGTYTVEILNDNLYVGSLNVRLR